MRMMMGMPLKGLCRGALAAAVGIGCFAVPAAAKPAGDAADSPFVPEGYVKVFADEMDTPSLDTGKWWTRYIYNDGMLDTLNDERQLFREDRNHVMTGGTLRLTAYHDPNLRPPRFLYRSGMIRSKSTFKYGYFEARLKVPGGLGVWPAFWLNSDARTSDGKLGWPPEIDILEFVNNGKEDRANMLHVAVIAKPGEGESTADIWGCELLEAHPKLKPTGVGGHYYAPFDFPDDFHVFAALWDTDDTVSFYVDGELIMKRRYKWVYRDKTDAGFAHVLLNLSIGGQWAGRHGIDDSAFPQALEVDYVRVYQKAGHEQVGRSTIGHDLLKAEDTAEAADAADAAVPAAAEVADGPTPYPDPKDSAAWPGKGPTRVFPWMKDNRAYFWSRRDKDRGAVVLVGDSLVGNWKGDAWKAAFEGRNVANRGIGGDVTRGVLFRLKEDVLDLNPRAVVFLIGSNDLSAHANPAFVAENIAEMIRQAHEANADLPIIVCTIPPRNSPKAPTKPGAEADVNERIRALASEKVKVLDLNTALADEAGEPRPEYFQSDLIHLSPKGYEKFAELLKPHLPAE